ncbi:MAG: zinc-dependent metalloprotease, partial [Planctomycetota bacterium]
MLKSLLPTALALFLAAGCATTTDAPAPSTGDAPSKATAKADGDSGQATAAPSKGSKPSSDKGNGKDSDDDLSEEEKKAKEKEEKEKKEREEAKKKWESTTEDLEQSKGYFTAWHDDEHLLLELDEDAFGREFLYSAGLGSGAGSGGLYRGAMLSDTDQVLQFERRGEKTVVLVAQNNRYLEPGDSIEKRMLEEVTSASIIQTFKVEVEDKEAGKVLINIGDWFASDNLEVNRGVSGKYSSNKDLAQFTNVGNFPKNLEVDIDLVLTGARSGGNLTMADGRGLRVKVHHSLCAPPEPGYKPRVSDQRVGYFLTERKDLFDVYAEDPVHRYINRWRLQKKDPTADVSDPVEPITYWIENSTPKKWRDAVRKGIEIWEPAFRKAGFSNGIVAKQMPEDADWDPADIRYSVVRWSSDENVSFAIGPSRADPRTGELFDADITMQAGFLHVYRERFNKYVSDLSARPKEEILAEIDQRMSRSVPEGFDPRLCQMGGTDMLDQAAYAATMSAIIREDFDVDDFLSAMLTEVVSHEVGHTLGLRHNFKSSTWLGLDDMAAADKTAAKGLVGSVMDYTGINIAGPGKPQGEYFASAVGPYDMWAIEYGYTEIGGDEKKGLAAIAARSPQPGLDYGTDEDLFMGDPFATQWDLGADPVGFAAEQIRLAEDGFAKLSEKGAEKGDGYHRYSRFYAMMAGHYNRYTRSLDRFLWGVSMNRDVVGQDDGRPPIEFVDPATQRRAVDLMIGKSLTWRGGIPDSQRLLLSNKKFGPFGEWFSPWSFDPLPRVVNSTRFYALASLLNPGVLEMLSTQAALEKGKNPLTPAELTEKVTSTVWSSDTPDEHDRWTQSDYVDIVIRGLEYRTTPDA